MPMFFFEFEAVPDETHRLFREVGGAFLVCWLKASTIEDARRECQTELTRDSWILIAENLSDPIERTSLAGNEESLERYDQARLNGFCYTAHTWPLDDIDDDDVH